MTENYDNAESPGAPDNGPVSARPAGGPGSPRPDRTCDYRTVCPNCGATLFDRGCKSRCSRCHFFTDCSDPW